ncbi:hypothetical protein M011DRAFT_234358 [Sporormia fimetaria CBS 119925]|uniref:Uncharacterized protein n=1 Tax=Sporormia fimetaria CBS 119925 TaxID=1340428 RepID=A0A6A6VHY1_9PLEO|nr:hypothetical protein M011DRAFT_234358 [Sporormia fimetaria CBS 119925]
MIRSRPMQPPSFLHLVKKQIFLKVRYNQRDETACTRPLQRFPKGFQGSSIHARELRRHVCFCLKDPKGMTNNQLTADMTSILLLFLLAVWIYAIPGKPGPLKPASVRITSDLSPFLSSFWCWSVRRGCCQSKPESHDDGLEGVMYDWCSCHCTSRPLCLECQPRSFVLGSRLRHVILTSSI